ncbi:MAG: secondary thiamine-phosphate synthase [Flavobacteriaceae bacterium]|nr:secondary thiamine-phosphate synthase [Flavobacteriaceae bacterium]|tara:strand:- start:1095 stop:1502 length:408 start_codon:yes stop_codon:yes gene_type:complete
MLFQKEIILKPRSRGFHLITNDIISVLPQFSGIVNVFIKHTSASLTINENADPSVRVDFENHFNEMVSENEDYFTHTYEGKDDMTSHIKSSLLGSSVSFPMKNGIPELGVWQGIYLCEHRNNASSRKIFITFIGE